MKRTLMLLAGTLAFAAYASAQTPAPSPAAPNAAVKATVGPNYVDDDGDGICDNRAARAGSQAGVKSRKGGYGPGDGTGNQGAGPRDGSGFGPGAGSGNCDGTGPKGKSRRAGRG